MAAAVPALAFLVDPTGSLVQCRLSAIIPAFVAGPEQPISVREKSASYRCGYCCELAPKRPAETWRCACKEQGDCGHAIWDTPS